MVLQRLSYEPIRSQFEASAFVAKAGVVIFDLGSWRVVLCSEGEGNNTRYFLPSGPTRPTDLMNLPLAAIREGFEESGFRNRLLPLPVKQPRSILGTARTEPVDALEPDLESLFTTEPFYVQLKPSLNCQAQFIKFWYVAETIPVRDRQQLDDEFGEDVFADPPKYPPNLSLEERGTMAEAIGALASHHAKSQCRGKLYPLNEAKELLGESSQLDIFTAAWELVQRRDALERWDIDSEEDAIGDEDDEFNVDRSDHSETGGLGSDDDEMTRYRPQQYETDSAPHENLLGGDGEDAIGDKDEDAMARSRYGPQQYETGSAPRLSHVVKIKC